MTPPATLEEQLRATLHLIEERKGQTNGHVSTPVLAEPLPRKLAEKLKAPLPPRAIKPHPTKSHLSTINPMFVIERLNDVFGVGGWVERYEVVKEADIVKYTSSRGEYPAKMIVVKCFLTIPRYGLAFENFGGNDNDDLGDCFKGACTDALTKCTSHLGIGAAVYKGEHDDDRNPPAPNQRGRGSDRAASNPKQVANTVAAGRPVHTPAQTVVAEKKIADLKAEVVEKQLPSKSGEMFKAFEDIREQVGEVEYLGVLNKFGITKVSQFKSMETAKSAYKELLAIARKVA